MNELAVRGCYLYFKTKKEKVEDALDELFSVCEKCGIEVLDIGNVEAVLRDEEYNDIESNY